MICNDKIIDTINKDYFESGKIVKGDNIVVGLSGGMDSMCLIHALYKLKVDYGFNLIAVHVHHGIRGEEADRDLGFVERYCKSMVIKFIKYYVKAKDYAEENGLSLEEAARTLRYKELEATYKMLCAKDKKHKTYLMVAHHANDQVETIIHNIVRGTGIKGLIGMKKDNSYILRPLLNIEKKEIENYIKKYDVPYVTDSTNDDVKYTRNFIRKEIVDKLTKVNDKAISHILDLSKDAYDINDYFERLSLYVYNEIKISDNDNQIVIDLRRFRNLHHIVKINLLREIIGRLVNTLKDVTKINLSDIIFISDKEKGCHLDLPYNLTLDKRKNNLIFTKNDKNISMSKRKKK